MRTIVKKIENPYRHASGHSTFERMRPIFFASLSGLVAADLIDGDELKQGIVKLNDTEIPSKLAEAVSGFQTRQSQVGKFVLSDLINMPINGDEGLKHRSGLIEHRYDIT